VETDRVRDRLKNPEWHKEPFEWFYQTNVFSDEFYSEILHNLPDLSRYRKYGGPYKLRYLFDMAGQDTFWNKVLSMFICVFGNNIRVQLCRDLPGYKISPHTDGQEEIETILIYLPKYGAVGQGTSVYVPKNKGFTSDGTKHHDRALFDLLFTTEYKPNSAFGFIRSDNSFHGVEPTTQTRDLIQVSVWR